MTGTQVRRRVVVTEAAAAIREAVSRVDRLTESLAPDLPESLPEFGRARGLLESALAALDGVGDGAVTVGTADVSVVHTPRIGLSEKPAPLSPRGGWFG